MVNLLKQTRPKGSMHPHLLLHLGLWERGYNRSLELYSKIIPHKKIERWADGKALALVLEDGTAFGLWEKGVFGIHKGRAGEHVHFAFQISLTEYATYKSKIETLGLTVFEHDWPAGHKSLFFFDFDGHQGELMTTDWSGDWR